MHYFILNPSAQSSGSSSVWPYVNRVLRQRGIPFKVFATAYKGHAREIASEISLQDPNAVITVIGGDGSLHEVIAGLKSPYTVTLGLIPSGSGNDFAHGMGIPEDTGKALEAILSPKKIVNMDVGILRRNGRTSRFGVSAGIGFDAAVCHEALSSSIKTALNRVHLGQLSYTAIALKQIALYRPGSMRVVLDGDRKFRFDNVYFISVMNQKYEGGGLMMTPSALPDDGILDVFVCGGISRSTLIGALPAARYGKHVNIPGIHFLRCKSIDITADRKLPIHLDGESGGIDRTIHVESSAAKLRVIVG